VAHVHMADLHGEGTNMNGAAVVHER
jgi:hypothetical protein